MNFAILRTWRRACIAFSFLIYAAQPSGLVSGAEAGTELLSSPQIRDSLPPHPRILFTHEDLAAIRKRAEEQPWAKACLETLKKQADGWLKAEIKLPDRGGQWFHYYACKKHGARLITEGPTRHVCPIDGEVFTGYPYDDVAIAYEHNKYASAIRILGVIYQLTGDVSYATKAKEILLAYAAKYRSYPLHDISGEAKVGGGKVHPQTLDESIWLITIIEGADCIWDRLSDTERQTVRDGIVSPAREVIRQHHMWIHNIQCWKNSAVGLAGLLFDDKALVNEAIHGEVGFDKQMMDGVTPDGMWFEGAWSYHFYTLSAVTHLTEAAYHSGINLYGDALKRMFDAPLRFAMPNLQLPAFNDSRTVSVTGQAPLYEIAAARYPEPRYRALLVHDERSSDLALFYGVTATDGATSVTETRNYPSSGYGVLTAGTGEATTWFCLKYGPHGGAHGHPDKLGFVLFGLGQIIAPDPGTASYGVPIQTGWYRTSLAHNTLTIDETNQKKATGSCEAFLVENGISAIMANAGPISDGVEFRRTAALIGNTLLVCIDQVLADREHTFDIAYHNVGEIKTPPGVEPTGMPDKPGYSYLRNTYSLETDAGLQVTFEMGGGKEVLWTMASGPKTTFITGTGVGANTEDRVPLVIARRRSRDTSYLWAAYLGKAGPDFKVTIEPIQHIEQSAVVESAAVRVTTREGTHLLVANPRAERLLVDGQSVTEKIAHFKLKDDRASP